MLRTAELPCAAGPCLPSRFPPVQGFVSNKTQVAAADPLETLLYQIFVAGGNR